MMSHDTPAWAEIADNIANQLFIVGFLSNKIKELPLGFLSKFLSGSSLISFFLAFSLQIASSTQYQQKNPTSDKDYNYSFLYGLYASFGASLCLALIVAPQLWFIGLWLFLFNNVIWYMAESNRCQNPSIFPQQPDNPTAFLNYIKWLCISFLATTLGYSLAFVFPNASQAFIFTGLILNLLSTMIAFYQLKAVDSIPASSNFAPA